MRHLPCVLALSLLSLTLGCGSGDDAATELHAAALSSGGAPAPFEAVVRGNIQKSAGACPDGAFRCGSATITGLGAAEYRFHLLSFSRVSPTCGDYTGTATFILPEGSRLVLAESGRACGPGSATFATGGTTWGKPDSSSGTWQVQDGRGQLLWMTGTGSSRGSSTGSSFEATYKGTLQRTPPPVSINEVESSGGVPGDWVELHNAGTSAVDVSGWVLRDNIDTNGYTIPAGTSIPAGGYLVLDEAAFAFGLGGADSARLFGPGGTIPIDAFSWTVHAATTYGRCPDGSGPFVITPLVTKGASNQCATPAAVVINEIESNGGIPGDWVELYNPRAVAIDIGGWVFKDNQETNAYVLPAGTVVPPGGYYMLEEADFGFGLGASDSARLFDATGTLVDSYTWTTHASPTYGRCPNGTGPFTTTGSDTKGATNNCGSGSTGPVGDPWPGANQVVTVDETGVFPTNLSDLAYEPAGAQPAVLWAVQNDPSVLYRLVWNGSHWTPAPGEWSAGRKLRYPGGAGNPDSEGVTLAEPGSSFIYVAVERDNTANVTSRLSVLRFDTAAAGAELSATHEWNLTADLPAVGPNLGLEAITWVPDSFLVAKGMRDERLGQPYDPAVYPNHGTGLFLVGVEQTGQVHAYALDHAGGTFQRVATFASGLPRVMGLAFDRDVGHLWASCDDSCAGQTALLRIDTNAGSPTQGRFQLHRRFERPTTMPNINNEGITFAPESECVAGRKAFFWADDSATGGHAIRRDFIPCGPL